MEADTSAPPPPPYMNGRLMVKEEPEDYQMYPAYGVAPGGKCSNEIVEIKRCISKNDEMKHRFTKKYQAVSTCCCSRAERIKSLTLSLFLYTLTVFRVFSQEGHCVFGVWKR